MLEIVCVIGLTVVVILGVRWEHRACVQDAVEVERRRITLWLRREAREANQASRDPKIDKLTADRERWDSASMEAAAWSIDALAHHAEVDGAK